MLAPLSRSAGLEDQLQLGDEVNSEIADGGATGSRLPGGTSVGDLPTSSVSAVQLVLQYMCSARTPPLHRITLKYWCMLHVLFEFITLFSYTFHPVKSLPRDSPTISTIARLICLMRASSTPCAEHPPHASTHASTTHPELCDACWAAGA